MSRRRPVWGVLYGGTAVGLAVFWWVDGDPTGPWHQAQELGLVGLIFGFIGWWLHVNRDALSRAAQAEAAAHGVGSPVAATRPRCLGLEAPRSNRLWHDSEPIRVWPRLETRGFEETTRTDGESRRRGIAARSRSSWEDADELGTRAEDRWDTRPGLGRDHGVVDR